MATVKTVAAFLESWAPLSYQESYDNSGLLVGSPDQEVSGILVALECTEAVVKEAIDRGCNLIVTHHPLIFKGLRRLTGQHHVERAVILAIRHEIALYAIHTNLDNVADGVNRTIAARLGLLRTRILQPKSEVLGKLVTYVPRIHLRAVADAMHEAGAGDIGNYKNCSFTVDGTGTFTPTEEANPFVGMKGRREEVTETRLEVIYPIHLEKNVLQALKATHPYEEVAYYTSTLRNANQSVGAGLIGEFDVPEEPRAFLLRLKEVLKTPVIRHSPLCRTLISRVAVCGGSGSFLTPAAIANGADVYVTADLKYHEFFENNGQIILADPGHFESEQFTSNLLVEVLTKKFTTFAVNFASTITNPISYL